MGIEGSPAGSPGRELAHVLNEALFFARKSFGMFGQVRWSIEDVTREVLTISMWVGKGPNPNPGWAGNVLNAIINFLRDLVPVSTARIVFEKWDSGEVVGELTLPFALPSTQAVLPSSLRPVEPHHSKGREDIRVEVRRLWDALPPAGSGT